MCSMNSYFTDEEYSEFTVKRNISNIKHIAIAGAGTTGCAYLGVYSCFEKYVVFENVETYIGTSAGALSALCMLLNLSSRDLNEIVTPLFSSFDNIAPAFDISLMITNYGLDNGYNLKNLVKRLLALRGLSDTITFAKLYEFFPKKLIFVSTNVSKSKTEFLSYETYPDLSVVDALFMSMCVPFLFTPVEYNGNLFVDGGTLMNIPVLPDLSVDETLFIYVPYSKKENITNWQNYIERLLMIRNNRELSYPNAIVIGTDTGGALDININQSLMKRFMNCGYNNALMYVFPCISNIVKKIVIFTIEHNLHETFHANNINETSL